MHIQEGTNTTLTTCTKMTEEVDRRHGVNGNSSSKAVSDEAPLHNSAVNATGGRLKFFKDGKFILELVRGSAREGERAGWVSVPRKTFWPPAGAPGTPPAAPLAPCASLSVSDDNSSVHSSPWQRDHCWKQTAPRKNLSKELAMYYCRPSTLTVATIDAFSRRKRRRPYDPTSPEALLNGGAARRSLANGLPDQKKNGDLASPEGRDAVDGAPSRPAATDDDREKYYHMKLKKPYQYRKLRVYKKTRPAFRRKELARTIAKLGERVAAMPVPVNAKLASCRQEHMMVSPRKRILRELERVSLEDQAVAATKRRAKTAPAPALSTASYPPSPGPSHAPPAPRPSPAPSNGAPSHSPVPAPPRKDPQVSKNVSSYSIHSLLSMPDESAPRHSPDAKRSPHSHTSSLKTESPSSVTSPAPSPSPDHYRYRYAEGYTRAAAYGAAMGAGRGWPPAPAPAPSPSAYRGAPRDEWGRDVSCVYPYPYLAPHVYRAPPSLWLHYPVVPPAPSPWAPLGVPLLTDHIPKDEPTSDLPLNLSKH